MPGPLTPLAGVRKLMPGHRLIVEPSGWRVEPYWEYPEPAPVEMSLDEAAEQLLAGLDESVRLRLMSDVPLGAMLSGGIDSSVIVALMARHMTDPVQDVLRRLRRGGRGQRARRREARRRALRNRPPRARALVRGETVDLAELVWFMDEPLADLSSLGFLALSELAASKSPSHCRVREPTSSSAAIASIVLRRSPATWPRLPAPVRGGAGSLLRARPERLGRAARTLSRRIPPSVCSP